MYLHTLQNKIQELKKLKIQMFQRDFLLTWEKTYDEILATLLVAECFKEMHKHNISFRIFDTGLGISIFKDQSTRTRFSFASAVNALGLTAQDFDEGKSQVAHGETVRETANMISFMADVIGIRDDIFLGEGDKYQRQVIAAVEEGYEKGILAQRPTVVNLQSDIDHPTQAMADLAKLKDYFGGIDRLKGKKIAMTWAYSPSYGKPLSVPQGVIGLMSRFGMKVALAHPKGYNLLPETVELARKQAQESGGSFEHVDSMDEAFKDADIVYPKSWASFQVMEQRRDLLHANNQAGLKELEKKCLEENAKYMDWECTEEKMKLTKNAKALYQHCLPADITGVSCKQGEVSKTVFERYIPHTYHQASFKPFVIAAMIYLSKIGNPAAMLETMIAENKNRIKV
ncbi:MAG: knotted carbamoyltransferase YgeW [Candidatus Brocadiae bacterium]|nr:knotted carbamoyltransferase YgeW [Candidatus Brocadiia bacterium]